MAFEWEQKRVDSIQDDTKLQGTFSAIKNVVAGIYIEICYDAMYSEYVL